MAKPQTFLVDSLQSLVTKTVANNSAELAELSNKIWNNPELSFEETQAAADLCEFLEAKGYSVTRNYKNVETAFLGEFKTANFNPEKDVCVAVLCEYDALPEIGHACGHNLIAEAGIATFIAVAECLKQSDKQGKILCLGTPAEEEGGGKILLIQKEAFKNVDFAMMAHPAPINVLKPPILGNDQITAEFFGRAAHAAVGPWEGLNALDAAVSAYNNVSMLRQQLKPGHLVHMVILNGGLRANVIPEYSKISLYLRSPTVAEMTQLQTRVRNCFDAAASATGCTLKYTIEPNTYSGLLHNDAMLTVYHHYSIKQGLIFPEVPSGSYGSTDMGNVSSVVPSMHPGFYIGGGPALTMIHTKDFQKLAGTSEAHEFTRKTAISMALTALELIINPEFRGKAKKEFDEKQPGFIGECGKK